MIRARLMFPISNAAAAAMLAAAGECWPGAYSGVEPDAIVIADEPMGRDAVPCAQAVQELLGQAGRHAEGQRWGERVS